MKLFTNLTLKQKILIMLIIPFMQLFFYMTINATHQIHNYKLGQELLKLSHYAKGVSALVHEVQKERGMSAGYIGSGGVKFKTKLNIQRNLLTHR